MVKFHTTPLSLNLIHLTATITGLIYIWFNPPSILDGFLVLFGYFLLAGVGNEIFYHRLVSHNSFKTYTIIEIIGVGLGILAGRGSPTDWTAIHRYHHKFADSDKDPHNPKKDSWRLFFPYFLKYDHQVNPFIVKDLLKSPIHRFITNYYNIIILIFVVLLASINIGLFFYFWVIPVALPGWMIALGTYLNHIYGYRNYNTTNCSKNNWLMAILLWGHGWHNNHHADPLKWNLKDKWWEFDLCGLIISMIKR